MSSATANLESESSIDKGLSPTAVHTLETDDLGHVPETKFNAKRFIKSFGSKDAWFGDYVSCLSFVMHIRAVSYTRRTTELCSYRTSRS